MGAMTNRRAEVPATWPLPAVRLRPQYPQHSMGGGERFVTLVQADLTLRPLASMYYGCCALPLKSCAVRFSCLTWFQRVSQLPLLSSEHPAPWGRQHCVCPRRAAGRAVAQAKSGSRRGWEPVAGGKAAKPTGSRKSPISLQKLPTCKLPTSAAEVGNSRRGSCQFLPRKFLAAILRGNRSFAPVLALVRREGRVAG